MPPTKDPQKGADAVAKFAKEIKQHPQKRKQYADNDISLAQLIGQGHADDLADNVKEWLDARTDTELQLLLEMQDTMVEAAISEPRSTGTLAKF